MPHFFSRYIFFWFRSESTTEIFPIPLDFVDVFFSVFICFLFFCQPFLHVCFDLFITFCYFLGFVKFQVWSKLKAFDNPLNWSLIMNISFISLAKLQPYTSSYTALTNLVTRSPGRCAPKWNWAFLRVVLFLGMIWASNFLISNSFSSSFYQNVTVFKTLSDSFPIQYIRILIRICPVFKYNLDTIRNASNFWRQIGHVEGLNKVEYFWWLKIFLRTSACSNPTSDFMFYLFSWVHSLRAFSMTTWEHVCSI